MSDLLEQPSTEIVSEALLGPADLARLPKDDWTVSESTLLAEKKRASFALPESHWRVRGLRIRFSARSPAARELKVLAQTNQVAAYQLTPQWKDYELRVSYKDLKKPTLKQLIFLFGEAPSRPFAEFRNLRLSVYSWNRVKLSKESRWALSVQPLSSVKISLALPAEHPVLFFGVGTPTPEDAPPAKVEYSITLISDSKTRELTRSIVDVSPEHAAWKDYSVDLTEFAGRPINLELRTKPVAGAANYRFAWSGPEIYDVAHKSGKPNVILISVDTLRYDRMIPQKMPNMAALSQKSIVYKNAYCTFPGTLPSHTSVMTGVYVDRHQVGKPGGQIPRTNLIPHNLPTIAEVASEQGYLTAGITDGGFVSGFYGFDQGFEQYAENAEKSRDRVATIDNGLEWLSKNSKRPFFLFLHSYAVHEPFAPPEALFRKLFPHPALPGEPVIGMDWLMKVVDGKIIPTEKEKEFVRQTYDAECYFYDQNFGRLLQELKQLNIDQNTVILIFGDHGELFFDRNTNNFGHAKTLTKEEIQVPLILFIPGKGHQERTEIVSLADIFPTLASIMGSKKKYDVDGISLLEPPDSKVRFNRAIYYEVTYVDQARWGVQTNEFKLVFDKAQQQEYFYDLRKDPNEKVNLSASSPRTMELMKNLLRAYIKKSVTPTQNVKGTQNEESPELREQLKALGYLN